MPAKMHTFYLRNMYIKNLLAQPGGDHAGGRADRPRPTSKVPACFVSTIEDHIAPWKSTYLGAKLLPGPVKFILGGSGHIAGIVNPPAANKYYYWTDDKLADTADEWLARRDAARRLLVAGVERLGEPVRRRQGARARSGRGQAQGAGGCARVLREAAAGREEERPGRCRAGRESRRAGAEDPGGERSGRRFPAGSARGSGGSETGRAGAAPESERPRRSLPSAQEAAQQALNPAFPGVLQLFLLALVPRALFVAARPLLSTRRRHRLRRIALDRREFLRVGQCRRRCVPGRSKLPGGRVDLGPEPQERLALPGHGLCPVAATPR